MLTLVLVTGNTHANKVTKMTASCCINCAIMYKYRPPGKGLFASRQGLGVTPSGPGLFARIQLFRRFRWRK